MAKLTDKRRTKEETEKVQKLSKQLGQNIDVIKTTGGARYILYYHNDPTALEFFKHKDLIKELFANDYDVMIWGNNHISLDSGKGFNSVM